MLMVHVYVCVYNAMLMPCMSTCVHAYGTCVYIVYIVIINYSYGAYNVMYEYMCVHA